MSAELIATATAGGGGTKAKLAAEIRGRMGRHKISGVRLAEALGRSQSYLSRRTTGEIAFDVDELDDLARLLDTTVVDLMSAAERNWVDPNASARRPGFCRRKTSRRRKDRRLTVVPIAA